MNVTIVNQTSKKIPRLFLKKWLKDLHRELKKQGVDSRLNQSELNLVFVSKKKSKELNKQYRNKNKPTDVLSFGSLKNNELAELVICVDIVTKQAKEHELTFQLELGYMVLHGLLHLLGYDHETSKAQAAKMFKLQDSIFDILMSFN